MEGEGGGRGLFYVNVKKKLCKDESSFKCETSDSNVFNTGECIMRAYLHLTRPGIPEVMGR